MLKLLSVFVVEDTFSEISDVGVTSRGVMCEIKCPLETVEVKVEVARVLLRVADESVMLVDALIIDTGVVIGKVGSPCVLMSWGVCPRVTEDGESTGVVATAILENISLVDSMVLVVVDISILES